MMRLALVSARPTRLEAVTLYWKQGQTSINKNEYKKAYIIYHKNIPSLLKQTAIFYQC